MAQASRKSSKMSSAHRSIRREDIENKRVGMIEQHRQRGAYYVQSHTTTFAKRQSARQNARYAALPDGAMHNLPCDHFVRSNDHKRVVSALRSQISSHQVAVEPKPARASRTKLATEAQAAEAALNEMTIPAARKPRAKKAG